MQLSSAPINFFKGQYNYSHDVFNTKNITKSAEFILNYGSKLSKYNSLDYEFKMIASEYLSQLKDKYSSEELMKINFDKLPVLIESIDEYRPKTHMATWEATMRTNTT